MNSYEMIFKRKSFHLFRNTSVISDEELDIIQAEISKLKPLDDSIKTYIEIVCEKDTTCRRGAQYCVMFYSEEKGEYQRNIGYLGEQLDLYLTSRNIGTLWFGIGKPEEKVKNGCRFVIMMAIAKMDEHSFRKDMFKAKRKALDQIWEGDDWGIANIVRFAPSACNTQPWYVISHKNGLDIYRYEKPGKRGIMPKEKVDYYNKVDMGIFLYFVEVCLTHEGYSYQYEGYADGPLDENHRVLVAKYSFQ